MARYILYVSLIWLVFFGLARAQFDYTPGFNPGPPPEMGIFDSLEGRWAINLEVPVTDKSKPEGWRWQKWASTESFFEPILGGVAMLEHNTGFPIAEGSAGADGFTHWSYRMRISFDRFAKKYRVAIIDNVWGLEDIYEGHASDTEANFSNYDTGTYNLLGTDGLAQKNRIVIHHRTQDSFILDWWTLDYPTRVETAPVKEQPWQPAMRMIYRRAERDEQ